jgi:hypothetical protein
MMCALLNKPPVAKTKYGIQIRVRMYPWNEEKWLWFHPTDGDPYQWDSLNKAWEAKKMYYPQETLDHVRVAAFPKES